MFPQEIGNKDNLSYLLRKAQEEWQVAMDYFQWVTEPDLIDYAIYWNLAAEMQYRYLLKLARNTEFTIPLEKVFFYSLGKW
ncbi:MAG: DUF2508 family protein [bacterium]|jgi:hypothetical protein